MSNGKRMTDETRDQIVALAQSGMSYNRIAITVGRGFETVRAVLRQARVESTFNAAAGEPIHECSHDAIRAASAKFLADGTRLLAPRDAR